MNHFSK